MRTLVYVILGVMVLLLVASFFLPSCGPDISSRTPVVISAVAPMSQADVTTVSVFDTPSMQPESQGLSATSLPASNPTVVIQQIYVQATADWIAAETAQAERLGISAAVAKVTEDVVRAQKAAEVQMMGDVLTQEASDSGPSLMAQALQTQTRAADHNQQLASARTVEAQSVETAVAYAPTATVYRAQVATVEAQAAVTVQAAKSELAKIEAQIAKAEDSLGEMQSMGLSTDSAMATLKDLKEQAEQKVKSLESYQSQITSQGGISPGWSGPGYGYGSVGSTTYMVQPGDTLYSIAQRFGVPVNELAAANGLMPNQSLRVGQVLVIPFYYPMPGPAPVPGSGWIYVVQPRDTMYSIARRFAVPLTELAAANSIVDLNRIWVGQKLLIPAVAAVPYPPQPMPTYYPPPVTVTMGPPVPPPLTVTPVPGGNDVYYSTDGKFSVQYPRAWIWGTDVPSGYIMFWARKDSNPYSAGFAVFSRRTSVWRPAREVLDSYKGDLGALHLMGSLWGNVTFSWDGDAKPYTLGGQLAMGEHGYAGSGRLFARSTCRDDGTREYLALTWAQPDQWDVSQTMLENLINTLAFTN